MNRYARARATMWLIILFALWFGVVDTFYPDTSFWLLMARVAQAAMIIVLFALLGFAESGLFSKIVLPERYRDSFALWGKDDGLKNQQNAATLYPLVKTILSVAFITLMLGTFAWIIAMSGSAEGGEESEGLNLSIMPKKIAVPLFGGIEITETIFIVWGVVLVISVVAILINRLVISRFKDEPGTFQNVLELAIEAVNNFVNSSMNGEDLGMGPYVFSVAAFILGCGAAEMLGFRSPVADINVTATLAIITFVLINFFSIRKHGLLGRVESMAHPVPVIFPIKILTDIAAPVSLACRMYGNMLGGLVVMELIYSSLIALANRFSLLFLPQAMLAVVPGVLSTYFGVFHVAIQAYIFLLLSMTYIKEGVEYVPKRKKIKKQFDQKKYMEVIRKWIQRDSSL